MHKGPRKPTGLIKHNGIRKETAITIKPIVMRKHILYLLLLFGLLLPSGSAAEGHSLTYTATQQKETTVYITKTGKKYHRAGCRYLKHSQIKTTKKAIGRASCRERVCQYV